VEETLEEAPRPAWDSRKIRERVTWAGDIAALPEEGDASESMSNISGAGGEHSSNLKALLEDDEVK